MPIKYVSYFPETIQGQAILNNFTRTQRALKYRDNDRVVTRILRGMPLYETETIEQVGAHPNGNLVMRGECIAACAYLKANGITLDLCYIDPPFASGADYAKKIYVRRNPKVAEAIAQAEEEMTDDELQAFEEKMYGDIWNKEAYLNWMYENLLAIKSVMSETGSIYVHLDWHIGHYVKVLMDEVFGEDRFEREIIWDNAVLSGFKTLADNWIRAHDTILYYSMSDEKVFNKQRQAHRKEYLDRFDKVDEQGRKYFDGRGEKLLLEDVIKKGKAVGDVWYDIMSFQQIPTSAENVDYVTQKPEDLLKRMIDASSKNNMLVADFFGGSGVTAKVAHDLGRKFIHVDVGINSIQTTRDRLVAAGASFEILEIKDGVALFRNPAQTMDKLRELIPGLGAAESIGDFWAGAIHDSKLGMIPVYLPNLLDHTTKLLDQPLMNRILQEAMPDLPDGVKRVVVYYIDAEDLPALENFIAQVNPTEIVVELRDLKQVLHEVVVNDIVEFTASEQSGKYIVAITRFISDRLRQKIDAYNQRRALNNGRRKQKTIDEANGEENGNGNGDKNGNGNGNGNGEAKPARPFKPIQISDDGLELIEFVSLDCANTAGAWHSDAEIKIDKNGYVILNGTKTRNFWDAKITCDKKPLRLKIRNIAGDETVIVIQ
ncbi:MAG: site-specific DNA-methyltransferase [Chloroflexi bacterium]|nr:site-specific DNA-methyltransferase [Chloroflexota bacterium]